MVPGQSSSPTASHSLATHQSPTKRQTRRRDFQYKYGRKHHAYDYEKAPYPLSYDRHVLELESLDNCLARHLRGSVSFADFKEHPTTVLDLGCGTGTWIIDAAKEWPECHFIGFDLVNIQIPLKILEPSTSSRIEWKHGNFLTTKLPFDDDEFDHVHVQSIATGVPENKWGTLLDEISRVLRPGGSVEVIEDAYLDIVFPTLPRWFTSALRAPPVRNQSVRSPDGTLREYPPPSSISKELSNKHPHDHALLESLYKSLFEHRFINMKPSSMLPSYFTTYFRQVAQGPPLSFPMPPLAPLPPLPPQIITSYIIEPTSEFLDSRASISNTFNRPVSLSFSSSISTVASSVTTNQKPSYSSRPRTASAPLSYNGEGSLSSFEFSNESLNVDHPVSPSKGFVLDTTLTEREIISPSRSLFQIEQLKNLSERSIAMHLYRNYQAVLACQEAMWEELKDRIRNRGEELLPFGWDDDEELEELQSRKKFERLLERYRSDMQIRISLWCSLSDLGWPLPAREPLSKAELIEEERMRENMIEARKQATQEEFDIPCRTVRVIVGYNF
ncbi:S-adenosyl-L-methionine-dependent methyltransferase [Gymnopilus junonius]|uniref:S-adenosyl-L-methionine-dependent methyltransferase n=1 Tax=Gymnopilus junonius TaxID=109634 RepID=A0A9P5TVD3_GYMJU|nr:S-adenosyl-L-methionine-dependent methyltransferase [Gymnopilus junonius]